MRLLIAVFIFLGSVSIAEAQDINMKERTAAVWANLQAQCGQAFSGKLLAVPQGDTQLNGVVDMVVHFESCTDTVIRAPFHLGYDNDQWNRSRTWIFIRNEHGIELRHDHRKEDGTEDATTWYGGFAHKDAAASQVEFVPENSVAGEGPNNGWRVIVEPGIRYVYGTIRAGAWRHHLEFDLRKPIPSPALPWGYETLPKGLGNQ
jgi:hypothetical protein